MVKVALLVRLSKARKETAVAEFLEGALPLANQESTTPVWFALRLGPSSSGFLMRFAMTRAAKPISRVPSPPR